MLNADHEQHTLTTLSLLVILVLVNQIWQFMSSKVIASSML